MTDKTYWGLNEIEINKLVRLTDKYKDYPNIFLSLEVFLQPEEDYNYFNDKIKINYPEFNEDILFTLNELIKKFKEQNEYNEYDDYLKTTNGPIA